jgi:hypothetical protein
LEKLTPSRGRQIGRLQPQLSDGDGNLLDLSAAAITWKLQAVADNSIKLTLTVGAGIALIENTSWDLVLGQCLVSVSLRRPGRSRPDTTGMS